MDPVGYVQFSAIVTTDELREHLLQAEASPATSSSVQTLPSVSSGPRALVPFNQPYCDRLRERAEKFRNDSKREHLAMSLERARKGIMQAPNELRNKKDFLNIKGVGPYIARELEDVLDEINGVPKPTKNGTKKESKKSKSALAKAAASPPVPELPRSQSLQLPISSKWMGSSSQDDAVLRSESIRSLPSSKSTTSIGASQPVIVDLDEEEEENAPKRKRAKASPKAKPKRSKKGGAIEEQSAVVESSVSLMDRLAAIQAQASAISSSLSVESSTLQRTSSLNEQQRDLLTVTTQQTTTSSSSLVRSSSLLTGKHLVRTSSLTTETLRTTTTTTATTTSPNTTTTTTMLQGTGEMSTARNDSLTLLPSFCECILILDQREIGSIKERHFFENRLRELGCQVEVRSLPLGDVTWIVRNTLTKQEFVCDTIIERKTADDLAISITDGRFKEQQSRLVECGMDRAIYLVEGNLSKVTQVPLQTMRTSIVQLRMTGFLVHESTSRDATCEYLARLHKTVLEKFNQGRYQGDELSSWESFASRARIQGCETVGEIFQAMLVQIPGCSSEKARAITAMYPTAQHLLRAYRENKLDNPEKEWRRREKLLEDIVCGVSKRRLGPKLSSTIAKLYCLLDYKLADREAESSQVEENEPE